MELIKSFGHRLSKTGKSTCSYGLFFCYFCQREVEKQLANGKRHNSCGCMKVASHTKHGRSVHGKKTTLYLVWRGIKARCYYPSQPHYKWYGGRGITMCDSWKTDYMAFESWCFSNGYRGGLDLDRIDNSGPYSPENCQFVTCSQNVRKSASAKLNPSKVVAIREMQRTGLSTTKEIAELFNVTPSWIRQIVRGKKWSDVHG